VITPGHSRTSGKFTDFATTPTPQCGIFFVFIELHSECGGCSGDALPPLDAFIRPPSTAHDAWPAIMHGIRQFRFYRDDVYAAFLPVACNQPLHPLPPGQVVPMAAASRSFSM